MSAPTEKRPKLRPLPSINAELTQLGLMRTYVDTPAGTRKSPSERSLSAYLFATGAFGVIVIPPEIWSVDTRSLVRVVTEMAEKPRMPKNCMEAAIYDVMGDLVNIGQSVSAQVLALGLLMAGAEAQGTPLATPARELAKEARVRYQSLLKVRRAALARMQEWEVYNRRFARFRAEVNELEEEEANLG